MERFSDIDPATARLWLTVPGDWRRPEDGSEYQILWDVGRAYGEVWPRPDPAEVEAFYRTSYYTHAGDQSARKSAKSFSQRLQTKISWLADRGVEPDRAWWERTLGDAPKRVLEIGCGGGHTLASLSSLGHSVTGVEPDRAALDAARSRGQRVYRGYGEALPEELADETFDIVIFMHVLEHALRPRQAVINAMRLLVPGGILVCEVPNNECLGREQFGSLWSWLDAPRHLNFFTERSLRALFRSVGLEVESIEFRGYCRQFAPAWKAEQRQIATAFGLGHDRRIAGSAYWRYLFRTLCAHERRKYDSVRVIARAGGMPGGVEGAPG